MKLRDRYILPIIIICIGFVTLSIVTLVIVASSGLLFGTGKVDPDHNNTFVYFLLTAIAFLFVTIIILFLKIIERPKSVKSK